MKALLPVESARTIFAPIRGVNPFQPTKSLKKSALRQPERSSVHAGEAAFAQRRRRSALLLDDDDRPEQLEGIMRLGGDRHDLHGDFAARIGGE